MEERIKIKGMSPQFQVIDLERSIAFYTEQLGFELGFRYEDFYAGISKDGYSIHLKLVDDSPGENEKKRHEHLDVTFSISHIEEWFAELKKKPVKILQPLRQMPYGKEFYISDPDEYVIAFLEIK
jgi:catechol 2,3-dioxygenase-like lactoylglutathione lyase family enzyme